MESLGAVMTRQSCRPGPRPLWMTQSPSKTRRASPNARHRITRDRFRAFFAYCWPARKLSASPGAAAGRLAAMPRRSPR
jgi:hypothetical protein